jgi:hypothetical protein
VKFLNQCYKIQAEMEMADSLSSDLVDLCLIGV